MRTRVLIVGGGPVGLTVAMDLAWRGIDVVVAERRPPNAPPNVKCGQIGARSMEIFRRLGLADKLRSIGLPAGYPNDIVSATSVTGIELSRVPIPARGVRNTPAAAGSDTLWPTPEHTHRCNQQFFEPVLFAHAAEQPRIRILHRTEITGLAQGEQGVTASAADLDTGTRSTIECDYLVGCDGASSLVRKSIGSEFVGIPVLQYAQSFHVRAPQLRSLLPGKPAWLYFSLNPRRGGITMAVDGLETWNIQNYSSAGETALDHLDRDWVIRSILGVGPDFEYEVLSCEDWTARRLVASKFRDGRVFICGDAAHVWMPLGGFGMSAGIADAANLAWKLAGVLHGWATPEILDAYEAERQPILDQASRIISDIGYQRMMQRSELSPDIERPDAIGEAARASVGQLAYALDLEQQCCGGLNFGYFYDRSPIIAYDGEQAPTYTMGIFTSSTVPGCRAPHVWLEARRSLYDAMGPDYTLLRLDSAAHVDGIVAAAAQRGLPLAVLDVSSREAPELYRHKLVLVRPDQHVAWRGDAEPADSVGLVDLVRGAALTSMGKIGVSEGTTYPWNARADL
jgi:2-polyprenyl-6-methoxyphenol hydroxylase-like FAD-dependent oxidoreductase